MSVLTVPSVRNIDLTSMLSTSTLEVPATSLSGKFSLNWRDNLLLAGVVLAVASAAGAFFLNIAAVGVACIALAILLAYTAYRTHGEGDSAQLQSHVDTLKEQNTQQLAVQIKLEARIGEMQRQHDVAQGQLNQTVSTLQAGARTLETANAELTRDVRNVRSDLQLEQHKTQRLDLRRSQLQQLLLPLRDLATGFSNRIIALGNGHNIPHLDTVGLDSHTRAQAQKVSGVDMTVDPDALELSLQIHRAQAISEKLFAALESQFSALQTSAGKLQDLERNIRLRSSELTARDSQLGDKNTRLQALEKTLQERSKKLATLELQFCAWSGRLQTVEVQLQRTQGFLADTKKAYEAEQDKLEKARSDLAAKQTLLANAASVPAAGTTLTRRSIHEDEVAAKLKLLQAGVRQLEERQFKALEEGSAKILAMNEELRERDAQLQGKTEKLVEARNALSAVRHQIFEEQQRLIAHNKAHPTLASVVKGRTRSMSLDRNNEVKHVRFALPPRTPTPDSDVETNDFEHLM